MKAFAFSIINVINAFILASFTSVAVLHELWAWGLNASDVGVVPADWLVDFCAELGISFTGLTFIFLGSMAFG